MKSKIILTIDAVINLFLAIILLAYSPALANFFGIPVVNSSFYPNILGAVFLGITIALAIEAFGKNGLKNNGLGLMGAICINLCGGFVLILWLQFGDLNLPLKGTIILWTLGISLIVLSTMELIILAKKKQL